MFLKNILRSQNYLKYNSRASTVNWRRANLYVMCNKFNRIKSSSRSLFNVNIICSSVCSHACTIYINIVYYTGWSLSLSSCFFNGIKTSIRISKSLTLKWWFLFGPLGQWGLGAFATDDNLLSGTILKIWQNKLCKDVLN